MADVAREILFEQIHVVTALRWRILRNSLRRREAKWDLLGMILAGSFAALLVLGVSFGVAAGSYAAAARGSTLVISLLFWGIFLAWQFIPVLVAGFGRQFEFRSLLRFPLRLSVFFLLSIAYGLADFGAIASLCWLLAMIVGVGLARPELVPALAVISAALISVCVVLERAAGAWLERLLARRRAREIFFALAILLSVSAQFIVPWVHAWGKSAMPWIAGLLPYVNALPPGLAGRAFAAAAQGDLGRMLLWVAGIGAYALLFGVLLWNRLAAQYRGEELSETPAPLPTKYANPLRKRALTSGGREWLSPQVDAVVRKEFHYLTRNAFLLVSLVIPPLLVFLISTQLNMVGKWHSLSPPTGIPAGSPREFLFPGMMAYLVLILTAPAYNCFAYEGRGIQTYFSTPMRFRSVFLGKNLLLLAIILIEMALSIAALAMRIGLPSPPMLASTLAALSFAVIGQLVIANWSSLNYPRKLEFGSMRNQRASGMAVLLAFAAQIVLAGACSVVFLAGRLLESPWLPAGIFLGLTAAAIAGYLASLDPLSSLAEKKREVLLDALGK